jgi:hypothetical protein
MGQKKRTGSYVPISPEANAGFFFTIAWNVRVSPTKTHYDLTRLNFGKNFHGSPYFGCRCDYYYRGEIFWPYPLETYLARAIHSLGVSIGFGVSSLSKHRDLS